MKAAPIRHVAVNVFRESVRDKVLYNLVAFALLLILASFLIGQLTAGQDVKIIKDLGLAAISIFGLLIAVFIGIGLVWKEVERRSIYSLLAKPLHRHEFVLGKFAGLALTLLVNVGVMSLAFYAVVTFLEGQLTDAPASTLLIQNAEMGKAVVLMFVELLLVTAIAVFFSTFSSPFLSASLTAGFWVIGHFNADLRNLGAMVESPAVAWLGRALYYLLPNFSAFDVKAQVVHQLPVPARYVAFTSLYGLVYIALVLVAGATIFGRRDFK